jgi:hypothetical protein
MYERKINNIEKAFYWLLYAFSFAVAILMILAIVMPEKITSYTLYEGSNGHLGIEKHLDWSLNENITLDRSVTPEEAIKMVKDLNETIKK